MKVLKKIFSLQQRSAFEKGLQKSKQNLFSKIKKNLLGKSTIDEEVFDKLESVLISSDIGVATTIKIIQNIEKRVKKEKYINIKELNNLLKEEVYHLITDTQNNQDTKKTTYPTPFVILVVGVNGVGKTTTIGKLAFYLKKQKNYQILLGAADTFRAGATDQLRYWAEKADVPLVTSNTYADPSSVAYNTVKQAVDKKIDTVIIDTAGRLHTKVNLINELARMKRVIQKIIPSAPHEVLLVLDASTGQNALIQAKEFTKATQVTGLTITKLDGTAKGGIVLAISNECKIPIKYVGLGEKIEDIQPFNKSIFVESLLL